MALTLSEAGPELTALAQRLGVPVITSPNGMGCISRTTCMTLGFIGRNGAYPANQAGRHADLVITIGTRFDDRSSSSWQPGYSWNFPKTQLVHVDIDPQELGRNYPPTVGIVADCKMFCAQLLAAVNENGAAFDTAEYAALARSGRGLAAGVGSLRAPGILGASPRRCARNSWSARCRRCCPTT